MWSRRIPKPEAVELHLEELDAHSWLKAVPDSVTEPYGRGQYRFVVVPAAAGAQHSLRDHLAASTTFPALRLQDPSRPDQPDAWLDVAQQRLTDLDLELVRDGWLRRHGPGRHWWSRVYDAPPEPAGVTGGCVTEDAVA